MHDKKIPIRLEGNCYKTIIMMYGKKSVGKSQSLRKCFIISKLKINSKAL